MTALEPRFSPEEFERRGEQIYARRVAPTTTPAQDGQFVAIDIETGAFEIDPDDYRATERLLVRLPGAQIWMMRVGRKTAYRM